MRSSKRLLEPFTFFVDECLVCPAVCDALKHSCLPGEHVITASPGTLDEDWLPRAGDGGWVCFSKDRRMTTRPNEVAAIVERRVGLFTIGEFRSVVHAEIIVRSLPIIRRVGRLLDRAFVARIEAETGALVVLFEDGERLKKPRYIKRKLGEYPRTSGSPPARPR